MLRHISIVALTCLFALPFAARAEDETKAKCPISGQPADENISVSFKGKEVYFCCPGCPKAFEKNPEKYQTAALMQMLITGQLTQVGCPISGMPFDPNATVDVEGITVGFCCENCSSSFAKKDDKLDFLFASKAFAKAFTLQTECPVSGRPIDPSKSVDYKGSKVFFCCGGCPGAFEANPEKFADKLPETDDAN